VGECGERLDLGALDAKRGVEFKVASLPLGGGEQFVDDFRETPCLGASVKM
jgi:hypothetical protein